MYRRKVYKLRKALQAVRTTKNNREEKFYRPRLSSNHPFTQKDQKDFLLTLVSIGIREKCFCLPSTFLEMSMQICLPIFRGEMVSLTMQSPLHEQQTFQNDWQIFQVVVNYLQDENFCKKLNVCQVLFTSRDLLHACQLSLAKVRATGVFKSFFKCREWLEM